MRTRTWLDIVAGTDLGQESWLWGHDEGEEGEGAGSEGGEGAEGDEGGEEEGEEEDESKLPDAIKKILAKEREARRVAEKGRKAAELKLKNAAKKPPGKPQEGSEGGGDEQEPKVDAATQAKLEKLSTGFRQRSLMDTLTTLAPKFQDPADILAHIDVSEIDYTQDDDDPSNVVWDEAALGAIIKDLAKRKPYLLRAADGDAGQGKKPPTRPSGSKFGGAGGKPTGVSMDQELVQRIPALRGVAALRNSKAAGS